MNDHDTGCAARAIAAVVAVVMIGLIAAVRPALADALLKPEQVVAFGDIKLDKPLGVGRTSTLKVIAEVAPGWHINSDRPTSPDYIPTRLTMTAPDGVTIGPVHYPTAELLALEFSGDEKLSVFSGSLEFEIPVSVSASFKPSPSIPATVTLNYQPCNNNLCLRPASISSQVQLAGSDKSEAQLLIASRHEPPEESVVSGIFTRHGYLLGFLFVLLAGVALNLTPCVYPLIAVTIAYFGNQGGTTRRMVTLALTYVLGIALMFSSVGVAVALSGGLFGAALQNPYVLAGIAAMLLALAASSFGWFSLQPPQWLMNRAGVARPGYVGALAMGLGMGVVAAPCIGPVVLGLLLLVERSQSPAFGFALFFTLAVGLGLPYVALALAAGSIRRLPRSGEWLSWIEQLFGFVLTGAGAVFHRSDRAQSSDRAPASLLCRGSGNLPRLFHPCGAQLASILGAQNGAWNAVGRRIHISAFARTGGDETRLHALRLRRARRARRSQHKPVVIEFGASWCIPCREMDTTTFADPDVRRAASRFVTLRADLTSQDGKTDALTKEYGIQGVPTAVFIDSQGKIRKRVAGYISARDFVDNLREID